MGATLADILAPVADSFLSDHGFVKGARMQSMRPILTGLMAKMQGQYEIVPGGSACNTIIGVAQLGIETAFAAKCGRDQLGALLSQSLKQYGISAVIALDNLPTGICLSLVTPDGERTMLVDLAASDALTIDDIPDDFFMEAGIAHFEAYMASNRELMLDLLDRAYNAGCIISLDLGSFFTVRDHFDFLHHIVADYVDVLIGNHSEGIAFTGGQNEDNRILDTMAQSTTVVALKKGAAGSLLYADGQTLSIAPVVNSAQTVVDTTGAGDLWNSGFLYGLAMGCDLATCGRLASLCGYEVCCDMGAQIKPAGWQRIQTYMTETGLPVS